VISAVLVSYRSASLARVAIDSFRRDAARAGESAEIVVVENSADPAEADLLAAVADRMVAPGRNLGFAGGLNAGLSVARGDPVFLANPDLVLSPGSVGALSQAVRSGGLVASGPAFFADDGMTIHLPPAEEPHPFDLCRRRLSMDPATCGGPFRRRLRRVLDAVEKTERGETVRAEALSGALVVTTRETLDRVGPFDDGFALYFEENDWQRRLRTAGGTLLRVGAARVVHRYAQSTRRESRAAGWFAESERRYFLRHFGTRGIEALGRLAGTPPWRNPPPQPSQDGTLRWLARDSVGVALSPFPWFSPFAWVALAAGSVSWTPPADFIESLGGPCFARAVDSARGEILAEAALSP
jgi:N-acetylglucosaminyl-diphospho-decaprenol L-rhamnosyltransferase